MASDRSARFLGRAVAAAIASVSIGFVCATAQGHASGSPTSAVTVRTLAQGLVKTRPPGNVLVNILDFRQVPNTTFKLNPYATGMLYTLHGGVTISAPGTTARSAVSGDGAFLPSRAVQTVSNVTGRAGAVVIAIGLLLIVAALAGARWLGFGPGPLMTAVLLLVLIAAGAFVLTGGTTNEWYLMVVRSVQIRAVPMPVAYGRVSYSSPDMEPAPNAPFTETLRWISVPSGGRYDALDTAGPEMIIVVAGAATVHAGSSTQQFESGGATFAQAGNTLTIVNSSGDTLQLVDFAITSPAAVAKAS